MYKVLLLLLGLLLNTCPSTANEDKVKKSIYVTDSGGFTIQVDDKQWFSSSSVFFRAEGKVFSTSDSTLQFIGARKSFGNDQLGKFEKYSLEWRSSCETYSFFGNIFEYENAIIFEQEFPNSIENTTSGDCDSVISSYPSFDLDDSNNRQGTGFAQWVSWYYNDEDTNDDNEELNRRRALVAPGFDSPLVGKWNDVTADLSGGMGGSGVLCVFEAGAAPNRAIVISPFNNFMSASHVLFPEEKSLNYGVMGNVTKISADFSLKTVMYFGTGINGAMREWGAMMRGYYGKEDANVAYEKDVTLQYLGFTTDNGAYYYYNTVPDMNYQQTVESIKSYADDLRIPYKYILLDSWFYYRGSNDGVKEWDAMPEVFPDGVESVFENTGWYVQAHNRYWAPDAVYAKQNGGKFEFVIDMVNNGAAPTDENFWEDLLSVPAQSWGLRVYEQDWLFNEVMYVRDMLESTSFARNWLLQMGLGASKYN